MAARVARHWMRADARNDAMRDVKKADAFLRKFVKNGNAGDTAVMKIKWHWGDQDVKFTIEDDGKLRVERGSYSDVYTPDDFIGFLGSELPNAPEGKEQSVLEMRVL